MYQNEDKKTKINPILLVVTGLIAITLIIIFFMQLLDNNKSKDIYINDLTLEYIGKEEWAKCKKIMVNNYELNISEYSFDNGEWQQENVYEVCEMKTIIVKVRNEKGKELGTGSIVITGIDNITPTIITQDISISVNEKIDLLKDVVAVDNESGISGSIIVTPSTIDTSTTGEYTVTYKVYDKAGNYTIKTRTIIVD